MTYSASESTVPQLVARVLLVDDEDGVRRALCRALERSGCEVEVAEDGGEAIALLRSGSYDVVISDVDMPVLDGAGLSQLMTEMDLTTPLIFMSGSPLYRGRVPQAGHAMFLEKPVNPETLRNAVRSAIEDPFDYDFDF